mmetsp:Transcript_11448/g.29765  ORF Transcript_11448/g.29765 Transcript_11448/m.29765 type:complete len:210 (-) Transcript_11448:718-1347(-)
MAAMRETRGASTQANSAGTCSASTRTRNIFSSVTTRDIDGRSDESAAQQRDTSSRSSAGHLAGSLGRRFCVATYSAIWSQVKSRSVYARCEHNTSHARIPNEKTSTRCEYGSLRQTSGAMYLDEPVRPVTLACLMSSVPSGCEMPAESVVKSSWMPATLRGEHKGPTLPPAPLCAAGSARNSPKSASLARPSASISTFSGLMSRCTIVE